MSTTELSEKLQTVKDLTEKGDLTVAGIADHLGCSVGSVYQDLGKLREWGELPPSKSKRGRPANGASKATPEPEAPKAEQNGNLTVEAHVTHELEGIEARIKDIEAQVGALQGEEIGLRERQGVLTSVQEALKAEPVKA